MSQNKLLYNGNHELSTPLNFNRMLHNVIAKPQKPLVCGLSYFRRKAVLLGNSIGIA